MNSGTVSVTKIVVRHRGHRQLQAGPLAHLAGIGAAGIDDMLAHDIALLVSTFHSPDGSWVISVARQRRMIFAPSCRAPMAIAMVTLVGSTWPSSGVCSAPITPSRL
jgi:hypothetical protein